MERLTLTIRQHVAAVGRRVSTLCKGEDGMRQQLALSHTYYNFCLPHTSLRLPLPQPEATHGTGTTKYWQPRTPAMAAGLTDHVWTLREVLCIACRHGRSQRWCEQTVVVGSSQKRGPEQAMCVHTACFKGVTRAQRAAGRPGEPSQLGLFIP